MGIVFGKQRDNVQVLTIKATQSLPAIRTERKFGKNSDFAQKTRSTSYQTTLPGLPNLISSDEEDEEELEKCQIPPPFTLPPLSHRLSFATEHNTFTNSNAKVVAELTSSSDEEQYSSCVEDLGVRVQREKTVVIREILGKRLDQLKSREKPLSSRESMKILSSRDSYRKTCLRSRKRARKNSCFSDESSLTVSHVWSREEDTLSPTGDETVSDVKALIRETPVRRSYVGLRFNSSSDEGLPEFAIRYHLDNRERRSKRDKVDGRGKNKVFTEQVMPNVRTKSGARVSSAWHRQPVRAQSKQQSILTEEDSYDACSELSTSSSEDELNYSNRFFTNPFLKRGSSAYFARQQTIPVLQEINRAGPSRRLLVQPKQARTVRPDIIKILPDYAKSSYNTTFHTNTAPESELKGLRRSRKIVPKQKQTKSRLPQITPLACMTSSSSSTSEYDEAGHKSTRGADHSDRSQFMTYKPPVAGPLKPVAGPLKPVAGPLKPVVGPLKPRKQNDAFDDLDSAVEMFKLLL
ncbi:hypothetical protein ACHWQZ_G004461 [Mnemiopsis leidyi]